MNTVFRGHKISFRRGYPIIYMPSHHKASKSGMVEVHYIVAEEILGRQLKCDEEVHHKDENKLNYDRENLMIFDSKSSHTTYHQCMRGNTDVVLTRTDGVWHCESVNRRVRTEGGWVCPNCGGTMKSRYASMCKLCAQKKQAKNIPSKKQLIRDKETLHSFCAIGRKYSVSDNAVRKWFRKYNLPL